ncbi:MAG TPA: ankyrin repeat domain-containing protein [Bryobacteraceae bacterium]|nr:ankyrin repeat domain-containing protein [Bryobacteraceae bacterium]
MRLRALIGGLFVAALFASAADEARMADAAQQDDVAAVRALIREKANVNAPQGDGMTALHWAATNDDLPMLEMLLAVGANVNAQTRLADVTPLFMASKTGDPAVIEALLKAGASATAPDGHGTTPLMLAAASGSANAVKVLLDHGADPNAKDHGGETALMFAAALNRGAAIKMLVAHGADVKTTSKTYDPGCGSVFDVSGCVPVDENGDAIDEEGKPVPKEKDKDGKAVAGAKAPEQNTEVAELQEQVKKLSAQVEDLQKHTGDKAKKSKEVATTKNGSAKKQHERRGATVMGGMTALLFAARDGQMDAARALIDSGANINDPGAGEKLTPLVMAISNGHYDLAKYLLDHGADPKLTNDSGLTALYATIDMQWAPYAWYPQPITAQEKTSYLDLMKDLLDHGADPNARLKKHVWFRALPDDGTWVDSTGATAFWRAAQSDDLAAMKLLVAHGANPWIATDHGDTPLMVAVGLGWALNFSRNAPNSWMPAAQYLLNLDADVNAVDDKGYTALHGAAFRGDDKMIDFLVKSGANVEAKAKNGDTVADMANGPMHHSIPHPETLALLTKLGSVNSHNCRSDQCVPEINEGKKVVAEASAKPGSKPAPAPK